MHTEQTAAPWLVYVLQCADGSLYCGSTNNLPRRLAQHNGRLAGGARYTQGRRPVHLLASRLCGQKSLALRLEAAVKARPRAAKLAFLQEIPLAELGRGKTSHRQAAETDRPQADDGDVPQGRQDRTPILTAGATAGK